MTQKEFFGRKNELDQLQRLAQKKTANLIAILGRRRIGKSTLIKKWSVDFKNYYEFQGLFPSSQISNQDQLNEFSEKLQVYFAGPKMIFTSWSQAFRELARLTYNKKCLILFDEISWMASRDHLFTSQLKTAWDDEFSKNVALSLVVCGSVSSWIEENILNHANFVGRISWQINLKELSLQDSSLFWSRLKKPKNISSYEKLQTLAVTGGIPKYLEELVVKHSTEQNLLSLCFNANGFLFNEYEKIFSDIFLRKAKSLEKIIRVCCERKMSPVQLAKALKHPLNSDFSNHLHLLEISGFIERDFYFKTDGKISKESRIRLKDNYLRFYLKYIEPQKDKIMKSQVKINSLSALSGWDSILGLQFENLLLNSRSQIYEKLNINSSDIKSSSPYAQKKTTRTKAATQIDLLIHLKRDTFYVCEFKCQKQISKSIIKEVQKKIEAIKVPKRSSLRSVLIYEGELHPNDEQEIVDYFDKIISFQELLATV